MHCGWFIDVEDFRLRATERKLALRHLDGQDSSLDDLYDNDVFQDELDTPAKREASKAVDDHRMCTALVDAVMDELGLVLHLNPYVVGGRGLVPGSPEYCIRHAFSLYTNYDIYARPSEEVIQKVREALGFKGEPMWFMDCAETCWVYEAST